jgi:hypothetical protein
MAMEDAYVLAEVLRTATTLDMNSRMHSSSVPSTTK